MMESLGQACWQAVWKKPSGTVCLPSESRMSASLHSMRAALMREVYGTGESR